MADTVCVGHGGLDEDGNPRCDCKQFSKFARYGLYEHCVCGHSEGTHLPLDSKYVTGATKKNHK